MKYKEYPVFIFNPDSGFFAMFFLIRGKKQSQFLKKIGITQLNW